MYIHLTPLLFSLTRPIPFRSITNKRRIVCWRRHYNYPLTPPPPPHMQSTWTLLPGSHIGRFKVVLYSISFTMGILVTCYLLLVTCAHFLNLNLNLNWWSLDICVAANLHQSMSTSIVSIHRHTRHHDSSWITQHIKVQHIHIHNPNLKPSESFTKSKFIHRKYHPVVSAIDAGTGDRHIHSIASYRNIRPVV